MRILFVAVLSLLLFPSVALAQEVNIPTPKSFKEAYAGYNKYIDASDGKGAKLRTIYAQKAYELGLKRFGPESINTANLAVNWVFAYDSLRTKQSPIKAFQRVQEVYEKANKDNNDTLAEAYYTIGNIFNTNTQDVSNKKFKKENSKFAKRYFNKAIQFQSNHFGVNSYQLSKLNLTIGTKLLTPYQYKSSKPFLENAYEYFSKNSEKYDTDFALSAYRLSEYYIFRKRWKKAIINMETSLKVLDSKDPKSDLAQAGHVLMVNMLFATGNVIDAIDHCNVPKKTSEKLEKPLPISKVTPTYPRRAAEKGIQGFVWLEFTVTSVGNVDEIKVICTAPAGYFERAAIKAALGFKYEPRFVNGKAILTKGIRNLITFELAN